MNIEHKKYLKYMIFLIAIGLCSIYALNFSIDSLWYFGGNKLFSENYLFNERFSKVNVYLKEPNKYDCLILGSSRVTLLDSNKISGYKCFNFSFSDGNPEEFIAYAKYVRHFGGKPKLTILGVDARFYSRVHHKVIIPKFVSTLEQPPTSLKTYLSFSTLNFSLRALLRKPLEHRYYTGKFIGDVLDNTKNYDPPYCFTLEGFGVPYTVKNIQYTETIKNVLDSDIFIGYIAPISAWDMLPLLEDGELNSYIQTMYKLSHKFDKFYDFSIPSNLTIRTDNNYDGHHYSRRSNDGIAKILNGGEIGFGLAVHKMSLSEYKRKFTLAIMDFSNKHKNRGKSDLKCRQRTAVR